MNSLTFKETYFLTALLSFQHFILFSLYTYIIPLI